MKPLFKLADGTEIIDIQHYNYDAGFKGCPTCNFEDERYCIDFVTSERSFIEVESQQEYGVPSFGVLMRLFGNHMDVVESLTKEQFKGFIEELGEYCDDPEGYQPYVGKRWSCTELDDVMTVKRFLVIAEDICNK